MTKLNNKQVRQQVINKYNYHCAYCWNKIKNNDNHGT